MNYMVHGAIFTHNGTVSFITTFAIKITNFHMSCLMSQPGALEQEDNYFFGGGGGASDFQLFSGRNFHFGIDPPPWFPNSESKKETKQNKTNKSKNKNKTKQIKKQNKTKENHQQLNKQINKTPPQQQQQQNDSSKKQTKNKNKR